VHEKVPWVGNHMEIKRLFELGPQITINKNNTSITFIMFNTKMGTTLCINLLPFINNIFKNLYVLNIIMLEFVFLHTSWPYSKSSYYVVGLKFRHVFI
jgi:hypothetical protein